MPALMTGKAQMPAAMIAEKASGMILADAKGETRVARKNSDATVLPSNLQMRTPGATKLGPCPTDAAPDVAAGELFARLPLCCDPNAYAAIIAAL